MIKLVKNENIQYVHIYIIDTSSLIDLKKWYPKNNFPGLWEKVEELINSNRLKAPIQVFNEVRRGDDELKYWCEMWEGKLFVNNLDIKEVQKIINKYTKLNEKNKNKSYKDECADPYVVALAKCYKKLVTFDGANISYRKPIVISEESAKKEHSLTNVCKKENIEVISISALAPREGWTFR